jgi:transposase
MRRYSDDYRATALAALDANGGNVARTARQLAIPRKSLEGWARGPVAAEVASFRHQKKEALADALEAVARRLLDALLGKVKEASLLQLAIALGICVDKMLLLRAARSGASVPEVAQPGTGEGSCAPRARLRAGEALGGAAKVPFKWHEKG